MFTIAIPYYSGSGHIKRLAESIASGIQSVDNVAAHIINTQEMTDDD